MQPVVAQLCVLAVAVIYYGYRDGYLAALRRKRVQHERVAYMLWVAASRCN